MNPRELVNHIRSGAPLLVLNEPLRLRRRTRSNPCDFNEFLQALQSSETIRTAVCRSHRPMGITEDEWVLLVKTLGSIKGIDALTLSCEAGSRDFHPFKAVADAVESAHSLREIHIAAGESFPRDPSGLAAIANALRDHAALQEFSWVDFGPGLEAAQGVTADVVLRRLSECPHLRKVIIMTKCASAGAMKNLLQLNKATNLRLVLKFDQWLAVTDEIRHGRCKIQTLSLTMLEITRSKATEAVEAVASALRVDRNLKSLVLHMENGFTDKAGVALAEALTVNKTLRKINLNAKPFCPGELLPNTDELGTSAYEAFGVMLSGNTSLRLKVPPFDFTEVDEKLFESRVQMNIEQTLNQVGRGRLLASSNNTTREEWVNALHELSTLNVNHPSDFNVSCLYCLLRLNPATCMLVVDATSKTCE